jgi:C1A family cysteine protease
MKILLLFISNLFFVNCFAQTELSYRYAQSSVKNQAARGTCTAFGVCAAFEVCPGVPSNLSEQYLYARIKYDFYSIYKDKKRVADEGEYLKNYIFAITNYGLISEERMPYNGSQPLATNDKDLFNQYLNITRNVSAQEMEAVQKESYRLTADQYKYLDNTESKNIETIKKALQSGVKAIPICYLIHTGQWQSFIINNNINTLIDLNGVMNVEQNGKIISINEARKKDILIEQKILNNMAKVAPKLLHSETKLPSFSDGGHCVTIVGYNQKGFIIKNSWGSGWADGGYATISYNFHRLFATEGLILNDFYANKTAVASPFDVLKQEQIRLKTIPTLLGIQKAISVCFFYEGPRIFPEFEKIEIRFYEKGMLAGSKGNFIGSCFPEISEASYKKGYLVELPSTVVYNITNGKKITAEIDFTYNVGTRKITNTYLDLQWKNRTISNGLNGLLLEQE